MNHESRPGRKVVLPKIIRKDGIDDADYPMVSRHLWLLARNENKKYFSKGNNDTLRTSERVKKFIRKNYLEHPKRTIRNAAIGVCISALATTGAEDLAVGTEAVINNTGYSISIGDGSTHRQETGVEPKTFGFFNTGVNIAQKDGKDEKWQLRGFGDALRNTADK